MNSIKIPLALCVALTVATPLSTALAHPAAPDWTPLFVGVDRSQRLITSPVLLRGVALRIDLQAEGIKPFTTPGNGDRPLDTYGRRTTDFLTEHKLQVAINTHFFGPCCSANDREPKDLINLSVHDGNLVSEPGQGEAILFLESGGIRLLPESEKMFERVELATVDEALGADPVLRDGKPLPKPHIARHPRSAIGFSADRRYCYLLVIDGRRPGHSLGAKLSDVAEWLAWLGADVGYNIDGGGSTTLVIENDKGKPQILNRTSAAERVVGGHLGFFAKRLDGE